MIHEHENWIHQWIEHTYIQTYRQTDRQTDICKCIHGAVIVSMEPLGWIHGTTWMHQWIHGLFNRFQIFLLQKCIQELAVYTWNHFVDLWIHLPS